MEHTVELQFGYTDNKNVVHKKVTFGHRLTGADLIDLAADRQSQIQTQYFDLIRRRSMTKFGTMKAIPPISVIAGLNKIDRDDLAAGFEAFQEKSREGRETGFREGNITDLYFGFKDPDNPDIVYTVVEMNRLPTGMDEIEADTLGLTGSARAFFLDGKWISKITTADGKASLDGPVSLDMLRNLDAEDIYELRNGADRAEIFFRLTGKNVSGKPVSDGNAGDNEAHGDDGKGDSESDDAAAEELPNTPTETIGG